MPNKANNKIIFFGTSDFAATILNKLLVTDNYLLIMAVTQPNQPVGRKKTLTPTPVKILAEQNNIPVLTPKKLDSNFINQFKKLNPDLIITTAYGKIIPQSILNIPKFGALNIHPSLLPKYRGPSPIQYTLLNGDKTTGATIIKMDNKMDHGPIITNCELKIIDYDNYETLSKKLAKLSAELLIKTIPDYIFGKIKPQEQNHNQATFTKIIKKTNGLVTADKTARQIYNMWRAYFVWPGIFSQLSTNNNQLTIKLINIELIDAINTKNKPLDLFIKNKNLHLQCANNTALKINTLQPEGKKKMSAQNFINGYMK